VNVEYAGGIISNVLDYARWISLFLHPSSSNHSPLSPSAISTMATPHIYAGSSPTSTGGKHYCLGLETGIYRSHRFVEHGGAIAGYMAKMLWFPELEWGCVVMHNSYQLAEPIVTWRLVDDFLQTPGEETFDAAGIVGKFFDNAKKETDGAREKLYPIAPRAGEQAVKPALPLEEYQGVYRHLAPMEGGTEDQETLTWDMLSGS